MNRLQPDTSLSPSPRAFSYADWASNAADCCLPGVDGVVLYPGIDSRALTRIAGVPLVLVHLDELPHARGVADIAKPFDLRELTARQHALRGIVRERALAEGIPFTDKFWERRWRLWASYASPVSLPHLTRVSRQSLTEQAGKTYPARYRVRQGVILLGNRGWSVAEDWLHSTGLAPEDMECHPGAGPGKAHFTLLHETAHMLQKRQEQGSFAESWLRERDADRFAFAHLAALATHPATSPEDARHYRDTIAARRHARALAGFLRATPKPQHWVCAATDDNALSPYDVRSAGYELRLRVWCRLTGRRFEAAKAGIDRLDAASRDWPGLMREGAQKAAAFAALHAIVAADEPAAAGGAQNALMRRMAEDVLAAAGYFCPALAPSRDETSGPRPNPGPSF